MVAKSVNRLMYKGGNLTLVGWQMVVMMIPCGTWVPVVMRHVTNGYIRLV